MAPPAVIFDLDGTLWDSYPFYARLLDLDVGVPPEQTTTQLIHGTSIVSLIGRYAVSRSRFKRLAMDAARDLALYPGVPEVLSQLKAQGSRLAVLTNLPGEMIALPLLHAKGLLRFFNKVVHAGNCRGRKPRPDGLYLALDTLGVAANRKAFYVGDRASDAEAASRAGLSFAWAAYGYDKQKPAFVTATLRTIAGVLEL